jgi:hypothetical protein
MGRSTDHSYLTPIVTLISALLGMLACGGESPNVHASQATHEAYESDPEYQEGLSRVLESAPTAYAGETLTVSYKLGYTTGEGEGFEVLGKDEADCMQTGCLKMSSELLAVRPNDVPDPGFCNSLRGATQESAKFRGHLFAKSRLLVVQKGVETGDQRITQDMIGAFQEGYTEGFVHSNGGDEQTTARMRKAFVDGCGRAVLFAHKRNPIYDDVATPLLDKCNESATQLAEEYLLELAKLTGRRGR